MQLYYRVSHHITLDYFWAKSRYWLSNHGKAKLEIQLKLIIIYPFPDHQYLDLRIDSFKNLTLDYCFFIVNLYKSSFLFFILIPPKSLISSSDFTSFLLSPLRNSSLKSSNMINMKFFRIFTYQLV